MTASVRHWDASGTTQILGPVDYGIIYSGVAVTARKFFVENNGTRTLTNVIAPIQNVSAGSDAAGFIQIGIDTATVVPPYNLSISLSSSGAGGVWGATGTYFYVVTATNGTGETQISVEKSIAVDDTTKKVTIGWTPPAGASNIKVYRSTTSQVYTPTALRTTLSGAATSFTDDGSAASSGSAPTTNTTAGAGPAYGTPPSLSNTTLIVGNLALNQQFVYWADWVVTGTVSETLNPRMGQLHFMEST